MRNRLSRTTIEIQEERMANIDVTELRNELKDVSQRFHTLGGYL